MDWTLWLVVGISIIHMLFHVVAAVGVSASLIHSHKAHKPALWKVAGAVLWIALCVFVIGNELFWHIGHEHNIHCEEGDNHG